MSLIFYKQSFRNPNFKDTPTCNYAHIRYIATRRGVLHNKNMLHGLFGKMDQSKDIQLFQTWQEIAKQARELSTKNTNIFRSVVSFNRTTANELGLKTQKSWQIYIEQHISEMAEQNNIKIENLQWACAVHDERHHPHCHVVFWDKNQQVMKKSTPSTIPNTIRQNLIKNTFEYRIKEYFERQGKVGNSIRKSLIKSTFKDEFDNLYMEKEQSEKEIKNITNQMVTEFEKYMKEIYPQECEDLKKVFETFDEDSIDSDPIYNCFNSEIIKELGSRLFELKEIMPRRGRLDFQFLLSDIKEEVEKYVLLLLENNKSLSKIVKLYINSKLKILQMYTNDSKTINKARTDYKKEARKLIANRVLTVIKKLLKEEKNFSTGNSDKDLKEKKIQKYQDYREYQTERLLLDLLDIFSCKCVSNDRVKNEFGKMALSTELSKRARKEYYLAHKDKEKSIER